MENEKKILVSHTQDLSNLDNFGLERLKKVKYNLTSKLISLYDQILLY